MCRSSEPFERLSSSNCSQPSGIPIWNFEPWLSSLSRALAVGPGSARYLEKQYTPTKFSHNTFRQLQYFMPHKLDFAS